MIDRLGAIPEAPAPKSVLERALQEITEEKQRLMEKQSRDYLNTLFEENSTTPFSIKNAQITNAQHFRYSFIQEQFKPLLRKNLYTLQELVHSIDEVSRNLAKLNIVEQSVVSVQQLPRNMWRRRASNEIVPIFNVIPTKRFYAKTGTNIGNGEGDGYIQFLLKNLFGGAENLVFDAVTGTKTLSSYLLNYNQPLFNRANYIFELLAFINTRRQDWIGSDVQTRGTSQRIYTQFSSAINHEVIFENSWRSLINLLSKSLDVISQLGDDFKSSVIYNWKYDTRNNKHLPSSGSFVRLGAEYSGLWKFSASRYWKLVYESQVARQVSKNNSLIYTTKAGVLYLLNGPSNILDRFFIGGPTDVRAFSINGLGPKSYNSSIGGDYFINGGVSLLTNIPRYEASGFKIHNFLNYGKLLPLNATKSPKQLFKDIYADVSASYGFGILYNHPMARLELNFVLPLAVHERDYERKGLQYGIGVAFL